jgi:hypothetical protein
MAASREFVSLSFLHTNGGSENSGWKFVSTRVREIFFWFCIIFHVQTNFVFISPFAPLENK